MTTPSSHVSPNKGHFPEDEELAVTSVPLLAASFYIGDQCKRQNDQFMLCKEYNQNPEACLIEGRRVTNCVKHVFYQLHKECYEPFTKHWKCLDMNNQNFWYCRDEEKIIENCVREKLEWKKRLWVANGPEAGYKEDGVLPAADSLAYQFHVWRNKDKAARTN